MKSKMTDDGTNDEVDAAKRGSGKGEGRLGMGIVLLFGREEADSTAAQRGKMQQKGGGNNKRLTTVATKSHGLTKIHNAKFIQKRQASLTILDASKESSRHPSSKNGHGKTLMEARPTTLNTLLMETSMIAKMG